MSKKTKVCEAARAFCNRFTAEFGGQTASNELVDAFEVLEARLVDAGFVRPQFVGGIVPCDIDSDCQSNNGGDGYGK